MTGREFIKKLALYSGRTQSETKTLLEILVSAISENADEGNKLTIPDIGTFSVSEKKSRISYKPADNSYIKIPPKRILKFTPSVTLKNKLNSETESEN